MPGEDRPGQVSHKAQSLERSLSRGKRQAEKQLALSLLLDPPTRGMDDLGLGSLKGEGKD